MNGISYGRIDGMASGANFLKRGQQFQQQNYGQQSHSQQPHFGTDWKLTMGSQQQPQQRLTTHQLAQNTECKIASGNNQQHAGYPQQHLMLPNGTNDGTIARRPFSAQSYASAKNNYDLAKMFRSYENIGTKRPLTKQVDQLLYDIPQKRFSKNALCQPPEFLKVFSDVRCAEGQRAVFDCVLLGTPRPRVCWLFNDDKMEFGDVVLEDTADICRCTINFVRPYHYGIYTVLAENEVGRAITTATLLPILYN